MSRDKFAQLAEEQDWLAPAEAPIQHAVRAAFASLGPSGGKVRDALHGAWLHEPLHAVITDVPIGAWTAGVVFDTVAMMGGSQAFDTAADASILLGSISAVGAAVTGINDWAEVKGDARRIGLVHALLNTVGLGLFVCSLVSRKRGARANGRASAALGYLVMSAAAHLGGNLVYEHGVGIGPQEHWRRHAHNPRGGERSEHRSGQQPATDFTGDANDFDATYGTRDA